MRQAILYLKAAAISASASLIVMIAMLYGGIEVLDVFFYVILIYFGIYFGMLAFIEEKSPVDGSPTGQNKK